MAYATQQIIKTTEGWSAFDALGKVLPKDYWLFERVTEVDGESTLSYYKFKISDGIHLFSELPYQLLNGHSARTSSDGYWEVFDDATQQYVKTTTKALGVDGKSAYEVWKEQPGNEDKTIDEYLASLKGEPFTYEDFTPEQLEALKGASAYQIWVAMPGNEGKTVEDFIAALKGDTGAPFTYDMFTPEQLEDLKGESAYQIWLSQPGNEGKTIEQFLESLKGQNGVISVDAPSDGKTYGRKDEAWVEIKEGVFSQDQMNAILNAFNAIPFDSSETSSITQDQMTTITSSIPSDLTKNAFYRVKYDIMDMNSYPEGGMQNPIISGYLVLNEDGGIMFLCDLTYNNLFYTLSGTPTTQGSFIAIEPDLSFSFRSCVLPLIINGGGTKFLSDRGGYLTPPNATESTAGYMSAEDKVNLDAAIVPKNITTATTLTGLSIANYSIKVTLSAASALSFASTPSEGWECMINIKNSSPSDIEQPLPNASNWLCDDTSMIIPGKGYGEISVRYSFGLYWVITKVYDYSGVHSGGGA